MQQQAASALRGLSWSLPQAAKVAQEGALEPLVRLLATDDEEILVEVCGALNNLSRCEENKYDMAKAGAMGPLIKHLQSPALEVASQAACCLASLCEVAWDGWPDGA